MRRFSFEKLVRDKTLELFSEDNIKAHYRILTKKELSSALKNKFFEEFEEVEHAKNAGEITEELADLQEVLDSLFLVFEVSPSKVEEAKQIKKRERGGFTKGIFMYYIDVPLDSRDFNYFAERKEKYPELPLEPLES